MKPVFHVACHTRFAGAIRRFASTFKHARPSDREMRILDGSSCLPLPRAARSIGKYLALGLVLLIGFSVTNAQGSIGFVQVNSAVPQTPQSTVSVAYTKAQTAGDLNVVLIGWSNSTGQVNSVVDSKGNAYVLAVGPTVQSGVATQAIYYASNITAASANTVKVTFSTAVSFPDIRIAEYSGIATASPVDVIATAQGSGTSASSGLVTTENANDLLVGADKVRQVTNTAGAGYTNRLITSPNGDILEDRTVTATGTYSATATLTGGAWIMQMIAFRAAGTTGGTTPAISSINPNSGPAGASVTITGTNFGTSGTVTFNGTTATPTSWSATSIVTPVPANATTGSVVVTAGGVASNGITFTITSSAPAISSLNPTSGPTGASVTITGTNFGTSGTVTFNGTTATPTSWSATSIVTPVPANATTGSVAVTAGGVASNGIAFTVTSSAPAISSLNPTSGSVGASVTITGTNFGTSGTVAFNGTTATPTSWSATSIVTPVPANATTGSVVVTAGGVASNGMGFTVTSGSAINLVQAAGKDAGTANSSSLAFNSSNTVGNWIGVVIRAGVSGETFTVSDSNGNTYHKAMQFNETLDGDTLGIFYAENVIGGLNTVYVSDTSSATLRFAIVEYSGLATTNSLDVTVAAQGTGTSPSSGNVTTTSNGELLLGAVLTANPATFAGGSGYVIEQAVPAEPNSKLILEDARQITAGSVAAGASLGASDYWAAGLAAFRIAGSTGDTVPPTVSITSPTSGATVSGTISVTASASDNVGVASVQFQIDSVNIGSLLTTAPYSYSWSTASASNGSHTVRAIAKDAAGNTATSTGVTVTVSNTAGNSDPLPPTVSITSPASGATVSGSVSVTANAADDVSVASVQFQLDGASMGGLLTSAPYSYSWSTTTGANGSHTLTAVAKDVGGNTTTSAGVSVTVSNGVTSYVLPLKASANGRYLIDQNGRAFLLMGDAAHSLVTNVSSSDTNLYMSTRAGQGFNAIQVFALCDTYESGCPSSLDSYSGVPPFTSGSSQSNYDLTTPNPAYWTIVDSMIALAGSYHLTVFLNPLDTGGLLPLAEANGPTKMYNYGVFLGNRYKNTPNLVWDFGNDFQDWNSNSTDNNLILQLMSGIASADSNHLQDIELNDNVSYSNQDTALSHVLSFDGAYTYFETYDEVLNAFNSSPTLPVFMMEANYEFENNSNYFSGVAGTFMLREQEYWTMTSGATGQLYGSHYTNHFISGWQTNMATPGALQTAYVAKLFGSYPWWNLVPDQTHQIVTSGYGTYNGSNGNLTFANYVTAAWVPDGSLAIVYDPAGSSLTVNLAKFNAPVTAGWYDPSNGTFTVIAGSPFANSGTYQLVPKGLNNDGEKDWVLVLEVNPVTP